MGRAFARLRPYLAGIVAIVIVAVVFFVVLPSIAPWRDVWEVARSLSWVWIVALLVAATLNVLTYAPPWMAVLPGLPFRSALAATLASTASTYILPGGAFVGMGTQFAMLRGWGYRSRDVTLGLTVASLSNQMFIFGSPAIALTLLPATSSANPLLNTLSRVGLIIIAAIIVGVAVSVAFAGPARWLGDTLSAMASRLLRLVRRQPVTWNGDTFVRFRENAGDLLRSRWHVITLTTILGQMTVWLVLVVAMRAVGISSDEVSLTESFAAWSLIRVLGQIPIVPGGFGIVELGLSTALVGFGANNAEAVAAMLIYRVLTVGPPLVLGGLAGATWQRHHPDTAQPA